MTTRKAKAVLYCLMIHVSFAMPFERELGTRTTPAWGCYFTGEERRVVFLQG